jgi:hypothetical protein
VSDEVKQFTFPKTPGACVDRFKELGEKKAKLQKEVAKYEAEENALELHLISVLEGMEAEIVAGKKGKAKLVKKDIPVFAKDGGDEAFYKYVRKTGAFHLIQKRLSSTAIAEMWAAGKKVPGITKFIKKKISIVKA